MSKEILIKGFTTTILSLIFVWGIFSRYYDEESGNQSSVGDRQKYLPYILGNLLPACILAVAILGLISFGVQDTAKTMISVCFGIFLHISLYYIILTVTIPLFRKYISARTCAVLWMLPNYLYITFYNYMKVEKPFLVIRAPRNVVWLIFGIWLAGFLAVFLGNIVSHHVFRSNLLKDAKEVTDTEILEKWKLELKNANMQYTKYRLMVSSSAKTPLSVGLFRRQICVVLPEKEYSSEELSLIFRHEIVHIGREDAWSKFFLLFCTAMCWFNPLMWIAMRKSAEDLELSCDETVLLNSDDTARRQYANLILNTAGDERGFTTCLSSSASALRYRLKNVMKPKKRYSGALIVGVIFFTLFMSYGYVALAYGESNGKEMIYQNRDTSIYKIRKAYFMIKDSDDNPVCEYVDENAFHTYMSDLVMDNLTGNYSFSGNDKELHFYYDTPEGTMYVTLSDHMIQLLPIYEEDVKSYDYYLPEGVDWEYLDEIFVCYPASDS